MYFTLGASLGACYFSVIPQDAPLGCALDYPANIRLGQKYLTANHCNKANYDRKKIYDSGPYVTPFYCRNL
jgi:hypothetical protein